MLISLPIFVVVPIVEEPDPPHNSLAPSVHGFHAYAERERGDRPLSVIDCRLAKRRGLYVPSTARGRSASRLIIIATSFVTVMAMALAGAPVASAHADGSPNRPPFLKGGRLRCRDSSKFFCATVWVSLPSQGPAHQEGRWEAWHRRLPGSGRKCTTRCNW